MNPHKHSSVAPVVIAKPAAPVAVPAPAPAPAPVAIATTDNSVIPPRQASGAATLSKRSQITSLVIPAGGLLSIGASGDGFQLISSPCPLPIRYDSTAGWSTYLPGLGLTIVPGTAFSQLEFQNPLQIPITIWVWFGWDKLNAFVAPLFPVTPLESGAVMTGAPLFLSATPIYFRRGYFWGYSFAGAAAFPVNNAANACIGKAGNLTDIVQPGQWVLYDAPPGQLYNLANVIALGNAGDALFFSLS